MLRTLPVCPISVSWPSRSVFQTEAESARAFLCETFNRADHRWNEEDTKYKIIKPILENVLGFPSEAIGSTVFDKVTLAGRTLLPDFFHNPHFAIETKKMGVGLFAQADDHFTCPVDQVLTYLDAYNLNACIVSNGWDWMLFNKTIDSTYFGLRFRLDIPAATNNVGMIGRFAGFFDYKSVMRLSNWRDHVEGCMHWPLQRKLYRGWTEYISESDLYLYNNAVNVPLAGRNSGFRWNVCICL